MIMLLVLYHTCFSSASLLRSLVTGLGGGGGRVIIGRGGLYAVAKFIVTLLPLHALRKTAPRQ